MKRELAVIRSLQNQLLEMMKKHYVVNGNIFALHGVNEHYCIKISQIVSNISPEGKVRYKYTENCSKNRAGGFN